MMKNNTMITARLLRIFLAFMLFAQALFILLVPATAHAAGSAAFDIVLNSQEDAEEGVFSVGIYIDSGTTEMTSTQTELSYDKTLLEFVNFDNSDSGFKGIISQSDGAGQLRLQMYVTPFGSSVAGRQLVTNAQFRAVNSGQAKVQILPSSKIYDSENGSNIWDKVETQAAFQVTQAEGSSSVEVNQIDSSTSGDKFSDDVEVLSPEEQAANPDMPVPVDTNTAGFEATYLVAITLKDKNGAFLADTNIRLGENGQSATTDANGVAGFVGVTPGTYDVFISAPSDSDQNDSEIRRSISIGEDADPSEVQEFEIDLSENGSNAAALLIVGAIAALAVLAMLVYMMIKRRTPPKMHKITTYDD